MVAVRLYVQEQYGSLTNKTLAFLQLVTRLYEPQYIVKADDDVYLRVDRVPLAIKQWSVLEAGTVTSRYNNAGGNWTRSL